MGLFTLIVCVACNSNTGRKECVVVLLGCSFHVFPLVGTYLFFFYLPVNTNKVYDGRAHAWMKL